MLAPGKKLPAISKLNTEIEALISEKNAAYNTYRTAKAEHEQLATAKRNTEQILHGTPSRQKSTNRSVKNRPEMIPKPYKRLGV